MFEFLEIFSQWVVYDLLNIEVGTQLAKSVEFFIYDTSKILILLLVITHLMSILRYYFPMDKLREFLVKNKLYGIDYFFSSIFGAITPFCSCSSIPLFIGFLEVQIPLGVTFAFIITSPLINEVAVALFISSFGWKLTIVYIVAGIAIGMIGGFILGKLKMEKYVEDFVWRQNVNKKAKENKGEFLKVLPKLSREAFGIIEKIILYVIIGVAVGAFIHGFVPENFFESFLTKAGAWSVPFAVVLAVPMYSNASGVIPVIESLIAKGIPIGTALAFMMAVVGLSLPEALILKKVLKWQLLTVFFGIVTVGIIGIGFIFNLVFS